MKMCEQYCQDKLKLDMIYFDEKGREVNLICSPLEQIYLKRKIYFKVLSSNGDRIYEIPIDNIKSIRQLPNAATTVAVPMTIVFRIKGRLAKNYKMREWERLEKIEADGSRIIVNKDEDLNQLIKRLMRYGKDCEIISPKFFKEEMIELINKTLSNYQ
jgi:predicted DNA-binding transcriptional regulator YafY